MTDLQTAKIINDVKDVLKDYNPNINVVIKEEKRRFPSERDWYVINNIKDENFGAVVVNSKVLNDLFGGRKLLEDIRNGESTLTKPINAYKSVLILKALLDELEGSYDYIKPLDSKFAGYTERLMWDHDLSSYRIGLSFNTNRIYAMVCDGAKLKHIKELQSEYQVSDIDDIKFMRTMRNI